MDSSWSAANRLLEDAEGLEAVDAANLAAWAAGLAWPRPLRRYGLMGGGLDVDATAPVTDEFTLDEDGDSDSCASVDAIVALELEIGGEESGAPGQAFMAGPW